MPGVLARTNSGIVPWDPARVSSARPEERPRKKVRFAALEGCGCARKRPSDRDSGQFLHHSGERPADRDYCQFLHYRVTQYEDDYVNCDNDDEDPQYLKFLSQLKRDGKSYALEVAKDGVSVIIKYDEEDSEDDDIENDGCGNRETEEEEELATPKRLKGTDPYKDYHGKPMQETLRHFPSNEIQDGHAIPSRLKRTGPCKDNGWGFLETLRDVPSNVLEEEEDEELTTPKRFQWSDPCKDIGRRKSETLRDVLSNEREGEEEPLVMKNLQFEHTEPVSGNGTGSPGHSLDENYCKFLDNVRTEGETMVFVCEGDSRRLIYECYCDSESPSDSEIIMTDTVPSSGEGKNNPFVTKVIDTEVLDVDGGPDITSPNTKSKFKDNLMAILRKPYELSEYERLYKEASERKPLEKDKDLRGNRSRRYRLKDSGKSYFDHHKKLAQKVNQFRNDRHMVLNILRGFFYWLENICQDGAFCPWTDKSCLAVRPR